MPILKAGITVSQQANINTPINFKREEKNGTIIYKLIEPSSRSCITVCCGGMPLKFSKGVILAARSRTTFIGLKNQFALNDQLKTTIP